MDPVPAIGALWQLRLEWIMNGQRLLNTFNYRQTADVLSFSTAALSAQTWITGVGRLIPRILDCVTNGSTLTKAVWQVLRPVRYRAEQFTVNTPGTQDEEGAPQNVSTVVSRFAFLAGRRGQGSVHLPPCKSSYVATGVVDAAQIAFMDLFATQVVQQVVDEAAVPFLKPVLASVNPALPLLDVVDAIPQPTTRVMRRRTVGVGK